MEGDFRTIDANRFEARAFVEGKEQSRCGIWLGGLSRTDGLFFSFDGVGSGNSYNEMISVGDDGSTLSLEPMGIAKVGQQHEEQLTLEDAARIFLEPFHRKASVAAITMIIRSRLRYCKAKGYTDEQEAIAVQDYFDDGSGKSPRYYQIVAINKTVEAIARGENRILLVMATGTGKTYTAFQIIWRLWKSGAKKRILFLVDRNILADQTKTNDFKPFGQAMTKVTNRTVDKSYEIYLSLYQAVTGTEDEQNIYKQFSPDFFDLVIVDECHRGSAADDAAWRRVLEYFSSATQIGMTATPKETKEVSNIHYFGEPLYTYSLKLGIFDGFLAPYKVVRTMAKLVGSSKSGN